MGRGLRETKNIPPIPTGGYTFRVSVTQTSCEYFSGPNPKKGVSAKSISSLGYEVRGSCYTFSESGPQGKNVGRGILNFTQGPRTICEKGMAGGPGGKLLGFSTFFPLETPAQMGCGSLLFYAIFAWDGPCPLQGSGWWAESGKSKVGI